MIRPVRYAENPLVTPKDVKPSRPDFEVIGSFNAGVIRHEGEVLMLMRVAERPVSPDPAICRVPYLVCDGPDARIAVRECRRDDPDINFSDPRVVGFPDGTMLTSISHLRLARSRDGRGFTVDETPALMPGRPSERYGLEDPRITKLGDKYYIVYKAVSPDGVVQSLATTRDFVTFEKPGIIFPPENMDAMLFPEKIRGRFAALHRPLGGMLAGPSMWVAYGPDPMSLGEHHFLLGRSTSGWDSGRVGGGAVPILTERGWLEIYHAATGTDHYCLGALLLDADRPELLVAKGAGPILRPDAPYEANGFVNNVVFTCGALVDGDCLSVYYGAADETMCGVDFSLSEILDFLTGA